MACLTDSSPGCPFPDGLNRGFPMNASSFPIRGISAAFLAGSLTVVALAGCSREEPARPTVAAPPISTTPASPGPTSTAPTSTAPASSAPASSAPATSAPTSATPIATRPEGSATTPGTPDGAAASLPANQANPDRPTASGTANDSKATDPTDALTKREEKTGMPEALHGNNHSSPALDPETRKQ